MFTLSLIVLMTDYKAINFRPITLDSEALFVNEPKCLVYWESGIYLVDKDCRFYQFSNKGELVSILGGKGEGPNELQPPIQALYPGVDGLEIIHHYGHAKSKLVKGDLEKAQLPSPVMFDNGIVKVTYEFDEKSPSLPGNLRISKGASSGVVPFCEDRTETLNFYDGLSTVASEKFVLFINRMSVQYKFYFIYVDVSTGQIMGKGAAPQIDRESVVRKTEFLKHNGPGFTAALAAGATYSKQYGSVITGRPGIRNAFSTIQLIHPVKQTVDGWFVYPEYKRQLTHLLHLNEQTWAAYSDGQIVLFELQKR